MAEPYRLAKHGLIAGWAEEESLTPQDVPNGYVGRFVHGHPDKHPEHGKYGAFEIRPVQ